MQWAWSASHAFEQGDRAFGGWRIVWDTPQGPKRLGELGWEGSPFIGWHEISITGVPTAAAMCIGPASLLTKSLQCFKRAAVWRRVVFAYSIDNRFP